MSSLFVSEDEPGRTSLEKFPLKPLSTEAFLFLSLGIHIVFFFDALVFSMKKHGRRLTARDLSTKLETVLDYFC